MSTIKQRIGPAKARGIRGETMRAMEEDRRAVFAPFTIDIKAEGDDDESSSASRIYFEGFANVGTVDRYGDVVMPKAFKRSLPSYLQHNPMLLYMHDRYMPVGQIEEAKIKQQGLWVRGWVMAATDEDGFPLEGELGAYVRWVRALVRRGVVRTLSIGFYILAKEDGEAADEMSPEKKRKVRVITDLELLEISLVTLPGSRESTIEVEQGLKALYGEEVYESLVSMPDTKNKVDSEEEANHNEDQSPDDGFQLVALDKSGVPDSDDGFSIVSFDEE